VNPTPNVSVVVLEYSPRGFGDEAVRSVHDSARGAFGDVEVVLLTRDAGRTSGGARTVPLAAGGTGAWLEAAVRCTSGEVLCFLDDDDRFLPGKIAAVQELFRDPSVGYFHNTFRTEVREVPHPSSLRGRTSDGASPTERLPDSAKNPTTVALWWQRGAAFNSSSISVRRELIAPYPTAARGLRNAVGAFLFYRALASPFALVEGGPARTIYRQHLSNRSGSGFADPRARWREWRGLAPALATDAFSLDSMFRDWRPELDAGAPLRAVWARNALLASAGSPLPRRELVGMLRALSGSRGAGPWRPRFPYLLLGATQFASPSIAGRVLAYLEGGTLT
jgi:hypothetical protein